MHVYLMYIGDQFEPAPSLTKKYTSRKKQGETNDVQGLNSVTVS